MVHNFLHFIKHYLNKIIFDTFKASIIFWLLEALSKIALWLKPNHLEEVQLLPKSVTCLIIFEHVIYNMEWLNIKIEISVFSF